MEHMWVYSLCQSLVSVSVIGVSVRICVRGSHGRGSSGGDCVSRGLRLCLGWVGALGGAVELPVSVLLNLRTPQCLYTCLTLVCCPLLVRQFTMYLLLMMALDSHLRFRLGARYAFVVTQRRALCLVLLSWVSSVLSAFAQFFWNVLDTWDRVEGEGTAGLGLGGSAWRNWTTAVPPPKYPGPQDSSIIGEYLPYGGFLSKFYLKDLGNFTYAEIHGSHWGVCAPDTVLSPEFLVYVFATTIFLLPLLVLLGIYLDLICKAPYRTPVTVESPKLEAARARSLTLSLSLLVLLCLPLHSSHSLQLFAPATRQPPWAPLLAALLFQLYGLVPPLLYGPHPNLVAVSHEPPTHPTSPLSPPTSGRKGFCVALRSAMQGCRSSCLKGKVWPEV